MVLSNVGVKILQRYSWTVGYVDRCKIATSTNCHVLVSTANDFKLYGVERSMETGMAFIALGAQY